MSKNSKNKLREPPIASETETYSDELNISYISEDYQEPSETVTIKPYNIMENEKLPNIKKPVSRSPIEILGPKKFYTDEFDAFEKYYEKIHCCNNEHSALNLVTVADQLPFEEFCELSGYIERFPRKDEQNEQVSDLQETNDNIEFAHPCLRLVESPKRGRHLITTTRLDKGEVIINEKATVLLVNPLCSCLEGEYKMYRCHYCAYAVAKFYTCTSCNIVIYCSVNCLVRSYNEFHKFECEALQRHYWKLDETDNSYTAFRMMLYGALHNFNHDIEDDNKNKWGNKANNYPYIYQLQTHFHEMPVTKVYEILKEAVRIIVYLVVRTNFFKQFVCEDQAKLLKYVGGLLVRHYCQAQINCVLLRYPNLDADYSFNVIGSTGKAICPTIALLNHACSPNAVIIPCNDRLLVKTLKSIPPNTEITISYKEINTFFQLEERQLLMQDYFYFERMCRCSFCTYEMNWQEYPYKCHRCNKGTAKKITLNNGKEKLFCKDCKGYSDVNVKAEKTAQIAANLYRATYEIEPILRVVENYDKIFPWDSWMLLDAYRMLFDKFEGWEEKPIETMKYGIMYFNILEQYLPRLYPPCLEARLKFFYAVAESGSFMSLENVTANEFDTIRFFAEDCMRTKKDLTFYIPPRYMEFYYMGLLTKLETVQFNLNIIKQ